ncbi:MAG: PilZ domain-containing protein [Terriglobales bacterium]|jgi:hypothetical protein
MNAPDLQLSSSTLTKPDRRRYPRYTVQVQVEIHPEGSQLPMRLVTTDLSRGGCYIKVTDQLPLGVHVKTTLWLDDYPIVIRGLVVTRHPQFGNGIMFLDFEGGAEPILTRYLDAIVSN